MYVAIDDTYGPSDVSSSSKYVTEVRRTHVGVAFSTSEVADVRNQLRDCLNDMPKLLSVSPNEFHFVDIYNRKPPWNIVPSPKNLIIFELFAEIYRLNRWPVFIQTIDQRTLKDHGIAKIVGKIGRFDLSNPSHLSLFMLMVKIKRYLLEKRQAATILIDEGLGKAGQDFGISVFRNLAEKVECRFEASSTEPLLQIADFIAYCVNRSTYLATKKSRSKLDLWFLSLVGNMGLNSADIILGSFAVDFSASDFDNLHRMDRLEKGLEF